MSDLIQGIVRELNAIHYGHYSSLPSRRGNRRVYPAKTSLWAKVETENGKVVDVWITKTPGRAGVPVGEQQQLLLDKYADLIGATISFSRGSRLGSPFFFHGRVTPTTNPDPS